MRGGRQSSSGTDILTWHSPRVMGGEHLMDDAKDRDEERFWKSMYYR